MNITPGKGKINEEREALKKKRAADPNEKTFKQIYEDTKNDIKKQWEEDKLKNQQKRKK